jgi:hypothetical protein
MALFSSRKPVVFQASAYGATRRRRGVPRWLVLRLTGIALGAGGVLFLQSSYGPPRLTVEESEKLHHDLSAANIDKQRLQAQVTQHARSQKEAEDNAAKLKTQLDATRAELAEQQPNIEALLNSIPPDPRGTSPGIAAASFRNIGGKLEYHLLIMQDPPVRNTFDGKITLIVEGIYPNERVISVNLDPIPLKVGRYAILQGKADLPNALYARMVTARVTQGNDTQIKASRTIRVR